MTNQTRALLSLVKLRKARKEAERRAASLARRPVTMQEANAVLSKWADDVIAYTKSPEGQSVMDRWNRYEQQSAPLRAEARKGTVFTVPSTMEVTPEVQAARDAGARIYRDAQRKASRREFLTAMRTGVPMFAKDEDDD